MQVSELDILEKIKTVAEKIPNFFFVQVGGFDGTTDDPLYDMVMSYKWSGIIVEPMKEAFERLTQNYIKNKKCILEKVAIAGIRGERKFYSIKDTFNKLPYWTKQLGSFHREVILKHNKWVRDIEKYIIEENVSVVTFSDIFTKHNISKINLLCLDTEGSDFELLSSFDFNRYKPELVLFEHKHLNQEEKQKSFDVLEDKGYSFMHLPTDSLAFLV